MSFDEFISKFNGQGVDTDNAYGFQCMDLMHRYVVDVLGLDLGLFAAPTAYQAYQGASDARFDKIDNTPTGVPQKGDIMFWNTSVGSAGHVAVFISGDTNSFKSFDQNWPTGSKCHVQDHDYKGVAGWLHCKSQQDTQAIIDELRKARDENWVKYQTEVLVNNDKTKELQDEQKKNQDLREVLDKQTQADANLGVELLAAQHKTNDYKSFLDSVSGALETPLPQAYTKADIDFLVSRITVLKTPVEEQVKPLQKYAEGLTKELPSLEKKRTSKKDKNLIQRIGDFFKQYVH